MFILSSISSHLEICSANQTSNYKTSELKNFKNIKFSGEISNNWPKDLLGTNACRTLESCWESLLTILEGTEIASVILSEEHFPNVIFSYFTFSFCK